MGNRRSLTEKMIRLTFVKDENETVEKMQELLLDVVNDVQGFLNPVNDLEAPLLAAALRFVSEMMVEESDEISNKIADSYYHLLKETFQCKRKEDGINKHCSS